MTLRTAPRMAEAKPETNTHKLANPGSIDLFKGWPNTALLPPQQLDQASSHILTDSQKRDVLFYGPDEGYHPLRDEIAKWLNSFYSPADPIPSARLCITGGASQNLACILQTFTDPVYTRNVWMVAPTYYLACRIFADSGFDNRLRAIPEDEQGIDINYLEQALQESEANALAEGNTSPRIKLPKPWRKIYKQVIYAVPTFANPSGRIMSLERRQQLVRLARRFDALIVTDDVYDMLQWPVNPEAKSARLDRAVLPRLVDVDRELDGGPSDSFGHAVSNGSFSKIIGPGCRTGWAEGTEAFAYGLSQTGSTRSGGAPSQLVASFISDMLATGTLQKLILQELQPAYAERYYRIMSAIKQHLIPLGLTMPQPDNQVAGGYFLWLTLPPPLDATLIWRRALEEEYLTIISGPKFKVDGDEDNESTKFDRDFRLCFAWAELDSLEEGIVRLARVIKSELSK
jgi:DNA-binding transcriptional MocR family regulator